MKSIENTEEFAIYFDVVNRLTSFIMGKLCSEQEIDKIYEGIENMLLEYPDYDPDSVKKVINTHKEVSQLIREAQKYSK